MNHANDMLEIVKEVNLNKLDKTLNKVMRQIQKQANKGRTGVSLPKRVLGDNKQLRVAVVTKLQEKGYKVAVWYSEPDVWIKWG